MNVELTADEVRRYVRRGISDDFARDVEDIVLHNKGGATVYLVPTQAEQIDWAGVMEDVEDADE